MYAREEKVVLAGVYLNTKKFFTHKLPHLIDVQVEAKDHFLGLMMKAYKVKSAINQTRCVLIVQKNIDFGYLLLNLNLSVLLSCTV